MRGVDLGDAGAGLGEVVGEEVLGEELVHGDLEVRDGAAVAGAPDLLEPHGAVLPAQHSNGVGHDGAAEGDDERVGEEGRREELVNNGAGEEGGEVLGSGGAVELVVGEVLEEALPRKGRRRRRRRGRRRRRRRIRKRRRRRRRRIRT